MALIVFAAAWRTTESVHPTALCTPPRQGELTSAFRVRLGFLSMLQGGTGLSVDEIEQLLFSHT